MALASLTAVVVAHNSITDLRRTLPRLTVELDLRDELIVVDNASDDGLSDELGHLAPKAKLIRLPSNIGFAGGANAGVSSAKGDLIVLLNPDAAVHPGFVAAIRRPWGGRWDAWMGLVLLGDGRRINTSGGVLHFTGFGWAGQMGQSIDEAPREPSAVAFLSGACLAIPRSTWNKIGGFPEHFFMYCEDVDLSMRLRLLGGRLAVVPDAVVSHDYAFDKGHLKWRLLERNRWATLVRTQPRLLLAATTPALLATEAVVWAVATRDGWLKMKLLATLDFLRALPQLLAERRTIQSAAVVGAADFASYLTPELDSPYFGSVATRPLVQRALRLYWTTVRQVLDRAG
jgi:N-acetylglucosaminyl-diphospho-decaprenol L-rhamnosyltransferase